VTLITDPGIQYGVGLPGGNIGSAQSLGPGRGIAVSVLPTAGALPHVKRGETLYTTAVGELFPPGIPVGRVSAVVRSAAGSSPAITVQPFAATANLSYVAIMLWSPQ
jgi:rod shape-determining protein MreC